MRITIPTEAGPILLEGRLAAIVTFVATHGQQIEEIPVGRLQFDFAGRKVQPLLSQSFRTLKEPYEK